MARTTTQLRDVVLSEGGFDSSAWSTAAVGWLNEKHQQMVVESRWRFADDYSLGSTVADQAVYTLPEAVGDLEWVEVAGARYVEASAAEIQALVEGSASVVSFVNGFFASAADADADPKQVRLYPTPTTAGLAITARAALLPADLDIVSSNPVIPADLEQFLIAGAIGVGELRVNKRADVAATLEQIFQVGVERLRSRRKSRVGSGPLRASVSVGGYR